MDVVLHQIALMVLYTIITFGMGAAMRYSAEMRWLIGGVIGFVLFGVFISAGLLNAPVYFEGQVQNFLWVAVCATPLGFIVAPLIMDSLEAKSERVLGSDAFDATYRKYAQKYAKKNAEKNAERAGGFRWYDAKDYHEWRRHHQSSSEDYRQEQHRGQYQGRTHKRTGGSNSTRGISDKDKMFSILGLTDKATDAAGIKLTYRKLARQYHPDILASQNLSEVQMDKAMRKMQEINAAYDWLEENGYA